MLKHTFNTWLLANLFHLIVFIFFIAADEGLRFTGLGTPFIIYFLLGPIVSCVLSLSCLFFSWLTLRLINKAELTAPQKFAVWLMTVSMMAMVYTCLIAWIFNIGDLWALFYGAPAAIAVFFAVVLRFDQFRNLFYSIKTHNHETNLV